jgi:hypothetical protein
MLVGTSLAMLSWSFLSFYSTFYSLLSVATSGGRGISKRPSDRKGIRVMNCWYDVMTFVVERSETVCVLWILYVIPSQYQPSL